MLIDWESSESLLLLNPSYSVEAQMQASKILDYGQEWLAHLWLATSGSTSVKWVGLSKAAVLTSAHAVNMHLKSTAQDRWALALPDFHVGGLSIYARSYLTGAKIDDFKSENPKWDAKKFTDFITKSKSTLTALVPTQLHDLVQLRLTPPDSLRGVIIGGGQLLHQLFTSARELGWKVMSSYGMTECASQVATAELDGDYSLRILPHVQVKEVEGRLAFKGDSLLSTYAYCDERGVKFVDPKIDGWFVSEDRGTVHNGVLTVIGRIDQVVKIGGENVDIAGLEAKLHSIRLNLQIDCEVVLVALPHARIGYEVFMAIAGEKDPSVESRLMEEFNRSVLPFERIRGVCWLDSFPKSSLSKILRKELIKQILAK